MEGVLYLEDGTIYKGKGFGKKGTAVGELVFNTSMSGYQEILTDPSYAGQIITMTYPLIGNYGVNSVEKESSRVHARGFVVKSPSRKISNYMSEKTIDEMLKSMEVVAISDVDTRSITKKIRSCGALKCVISNEELPSEIIKTYLSRGNSEIENYMQEVSTKHIISIKGSGPKIALIDFGVKGNIINNLKQRDCDIVVFPYNTPYEQVMSINPKGVLLSNGPGDPKSVPEGIELAKKIMKKVPTFGICLGHQILALAFGADTYKMKYGHRGGNHGVHDLELDKSYITSQNHGYAVEPNSLKNKGIVITHKNLNDDTIEGMRHKELPVFSVQFHPEGAPGPMDTAYLFDKFVAAAGVN
jgi:carbamoyl-phosphate synthase small subunit